MFLVFTTSTYYLSAQGVLLGLVVDNRLEVTNCFPFPRNASNEEGEDFDEVNFRDVVGYGQDIVTR